MSSHEVCERLRLIVGSKQRVELGGCSFSWAQAFADDELADDPFLPAGFAPGQRVPYFVSTSMPISLSSGVGRTPPALTITASLRNARAFSALLDFDVVLLDPISAPRAMGQYWPYVLMTPVFYHRRQL